MKEIILKKEDLERVNGGVEEKRILPLDQQSIRIIPHSQEAVLVQPHAASRPYGMPGGTLRASSSAIFGNITETE